MRVLSRIGLGAVLLWGITAGPGAKAELATGIKAIVHDSIITYEDVEDLTEEPAAQLRRDYGNNPQEYNKRLEAVREENLQKLVGRYLILHEFKSAGYSLPDSVIDDVVQSRIRTLFGDRRKATQTLQARGLTIDKFREHERERFIEQAMRNKNVSQEIIISPHKLEAYYKAHQDEYKVEEEVKLRTIVLHKTALSEPEKTRKKAEEILSRLKDVAPATPAVAAPTPANGTNQTGLVKAFAERAGGTNETELVKTFAELAGLYSEGPEAKQGGARQMQEIRELRSELQSTVTKLKPGEFSDVIVTPDSFWIVLVEEKKPAHLKTLPDMRDQIEKELTLAERKRLEEQWIAKLRKKTFVQYF